MAGCACGADPHAMNARLDVPLAARLIAISAVAAFAAAAAALLVGFAVFWIVLSASSDSDVWAELGAAIFGAVLGLAAAVLTYAAATIVAVRRVFPVGRRLRPALAVLVVPLALTVILLPLEAGAASSYQWLVAIAMALAAGGAAVGLALLGGVVENKRGLSVLAALLLGALVVSGTAAVASEAAERDERPAPVQSTGTEEFLTACGRQC